MITTLLSSLGLYELLTVNGHMAPIGAVESITAAIVGFLR